MTTTDDNPASHELIETDEGPVLHARGDWTLAGLRTLARRFLDDHRPEGVIAIDLSGLERLDTSGALVLVKLLRESGQTAETLPSAHLRGTNTRYGDLLDEVHTATEEEVDPRRPGPQGLAGVLDRLGRGAVSVLREIRSTLAFIGEALTTLAGLLVRPSRMRWASVVSIAEEAGVDALPIVAFLSFFVGMVVAFIGATTLSDLGAEIFVVELIGISMLREFGVVLTAIILAGRTNSSFTAQIGAMKMRQEIDALTVIGMPAMQVLVAPRLLAMLIMVPVLTFVATFSGVLGGIVVAWAALDISPGLFLNRMVENVPVKHLWVGLSKTPAVALIVALIGCRQGMRVGKSVTSLGQSTTASVVHALFAIIVMDALFALFFLELDI